jgi:sulfur relay (sulfurtransferase) DsrC/TusE family protein
MLEMNPDEILATIREIYKTRKEALPIGMLWSKLRPTTKSDKDKIRFAVVYLKNKGLIDYNIETGYLNPIFTEEEKTLAGDKKIYMTEELVRNCIRSFFRLNSEYPSSSEIVNKFIEMFGKPDNKDPDRYIRKLFEEGKLERDSNNKYFFKGIEFSNIGLRNYL